MAGGKITNEGSEEEEEKEEDKQEQEEEGSEEEVEEEWEEDSDEEDQDQNSNHRQRKKHLQGTPKKRHCQRRLLFTPAVHGTRNQDFQIEPEDEPCSLEKESYVTY